MCQVIHMNFKFRLGTFTFGNPSRDWEKLPRFGGGQYQKTESHLSEPSGPRMCTNLNRQTRKLGAHFYLLDRYCCPDSSYQQWLAALVCLRAHARVSPRRQAAGHVCMWREVLSERCQFHSINSSDRTFPVGAIKPNLQSARDQTFLARPSLTTHAVISTRL